MSVTAARRSTETLDFPALTGWVTVDPDAEAIVDTQRVWTYREVADTAGDLTAALASLRAGDVVAVLTPRTAPGVIGVLAVARAGLAFLAIDPALPPARIGELVVHSGSRVVLAEPGAQLPLSPGVRRVALPHEPSRGGSGQGQRVEPSGETLAYLVYTSGTTGEPKGVAVRHRGLRVVAAEQRRVLGTTPDSRIYQMANVSFDAFVFELLMAFEVGAALVLPGEHGAYPGHRLAQRLREQRVSHLVATPTALSATPATALPDLRVVCSVGERCTPAVQDRWAQGRQLLNLYGPAEATIWSTWAVLTPHTDPAGIGRPIRGAGVLVLDERGEPVPAGGDGELCVVGPTVATGYHRAPQASVGRFAVAPAGLAHAIITDGATEIAANAMYRTGDRVRLDQDGTLHYLGRFDDQVKVNGVRVEPAESQHAIAALPGVTAAVVVAVPAADGGLRLAAAYTGEPSPQEVSAQLRVRLPRWLLPTQLVRLDAMPANANGKLDIAAVRQRLSQLATEAGSGPADNHGGLLGDPDSSARDRGGVAHDGGGVVGDDGAGVHQVVVQAARAVLGSPALDLRANFFDAGGHSMLAVQLTDRVGRELCAQLDFGVLLEAPTISDWADAVQQHLEAQAESAPSPAMQIAPAAAGRVTAAQTEILVAEQFVLGSAAYVNAWCENVTEPFDPQRFAAALREAAQRYESLRARYRMTAHGAEAIVDPEAAVAVEVTAAADMPAAVELAELAVARPFDLAQQQPVRLHVVSVGQLNQHLVTVMIHHVASDAASVQLVLDEAWRTYGSGEGAHRPPAMPYSEFAAWQESFLAGPDAARQRAWWRNNLAGLAPLRLRAPVAGQAIDAARHRQGLRRPFVLGSELILRLDEVGRRLRVGTFSLLSAACAVALQDYLTNVDCVIGTPCTVRREPFHETVGLFVNTLLLPLWLPASGSLADWLREWSARCSAAFARRDLPLFEVSQSWRADGRPQIMFAVDYTPIEPARAGRRVRLDPGPVKYDLLITINRGGPSWAGEIVHDLAALTQAEAGEILQAFLDTVEAICDLCDAGEPADVAALHRARPQPSITAPEFDFGAPSPSAFETREVDAR